MLVLVFLVVVVFVVAVVVSGVLMWCRFRRSECLFYTDPATVPEAPAEELMLKDAAFSQWPSCGVPGQQGMCISPRSTLAAMGYSVRTVGWRYTGESSQHNQPTQSADTIRHLYSNHRPQDGLGQTGSSTFGQRLSLHMTLYANNIPCHNLC